MNCLQGRKHPDGMCGEMKLKVLHRPGFWKMQGKEMVIVAFVSVPKDLTKVKNKVVLNLTKRQLICLVIAAAVGLPFYFLTREWIGTSNAATGMVILMLPAFMFAMYEKDGLPLEKILLNVIHVKLRYPAIRRYEIENLYEIQETVTTEKRKRGGSGHAEKKKRK